MKAAIYITLDTEVLNELGKLPKGKPSQLVNAYFRNFFELNKKPEVKDDSN